jgi:DNA processing protein
LSPARLHSLAPGDLPGWLRLTQTPRLGPSLIRQLLAAFGLPEAIFSAPVNALREHLPETLVRALLAPPRPLLQAQIDLTLAWMKLPDHHIVTLSDQAYPDSLLDLSDPPSLLYVCGRLNLLRQPALGVVGARHATVQGAQNAEAFATTLSQAGYTVVSGLALGIDGAAHTGGLRGPGSTVAVIGTGVDLVYPSRHQALSERIAAEGAIVSEFPLGAPATRFHFPRRNRLIAALGRGVLVVEAALQSGSLITARLANELGREVFAIPGSIHSPLSKGCHRLLREGAKLVESAQDILEELPENTRPHVAPRVDASAAPIRKHTSQKSGDLIPTGSASDQALLTALGHDPVSLEALCERLSEAASDLSAQLFSLELSGAVERLPGNVFRRLV